MKRLVATAVALIFMSGCYRAAITAPVAAMTAEQDDYGVVWLWGATRTTTETACENGIARVQTKVPWWGVLFVVPLTVGLITPIQTTYQCQPVRRGEGR